MPKPSRFFRSRLIPLLPRRPQCSPFMLYVCHQARATSATARADQGSRLHPALQGKRTRFSGSTKFLEKPPALGEAIC